MTRSSRSTVLLLVAVLSIFLAQPAFAGTAARDKVKALLERECTHLDQQRLLGLIGSRFPSEMADELPPELFQIMEGVIKRTDFDTIPEEKTVELIELVYGAFKKGAPLDQLDKIFDVAYVKTVSVDRLAAAAKALKEFSSSAVPEEIYEEFVYRSLEDEWDPAAMPVLSRGLIYSVERGLTPQRTALVIMLDIRNGELKKKSADQLVLDAIKLVREKEPRNWKPMKPAEKELLAKQERQKKVEQLQRAAEQNKKRKEEERRLAEQNLRTLHGVQERAAQERRARQIEEAILAYQKEIQQYQQDQALLTAAVMQQKAALEREQEVMNRKREEERRRQIQTMELDVLRFGRTRRLNMMLLQSSVDRYLGTPYRYGGDSEAGIDCSAFTRKVYRDQGIELPRTARQQAGVGLGMHDGTVRPGDLVFFDPSIMGTISHVGVYMGENTFAHASSSRGVVKSSLRERYYQKRFVQANRIFEQ